MLRTRLLTLVVLILAGCNLSSTPPALPPALSSQMLSCAQLVSKTVQLVRTACGSTGRNTACYGNGLIEAIFQEGTAPRFSASGDVADLLSVRRITTSPLDEAAQTWGITVLKARVNIPDTIPGQGVLFLLYGDTTLDNTSTTMSAVRLRTGIEPPACPEEPPSAMIIQSPSGTSVTLNLNGATLTLGSTLHITAVQNSSMTIATIEGTGIVSAFDTTRFIHPGAQVILPLSGEDGLQVNGPPSEPEPFDTAAIQRAPLSLLERPVNIPAPIVQPVTATSPQVATATTAAPVNPQRPATTAVSCVPRGDWTTTYTIQRGDTLSAIARRFQLSPAELQQGNCITNPNVIFPGQVLNVPSQTLPSAVPTAATAAPSTLPPPPLLTNMPLSPNEPAPVVSRQP